MIAKEAATTSAQGLRARKKARTFDLIQSNGLRLFTEKGFENTTIEEIAEASDISVSTFFRYFPTKEDIVLYDALDPLLIDTFSKLPASLTPLQAMRQAMTVTFGSLSKGELTTLQQRQELIFKTPALHGKMLEELLRNIELTAMLTAQRAGIDPQSTAARSFAGAFIGVNLAAIASMKQEEHFSIEQYQKEFSRLLDEFDHHYTTL